ncbi:hypothetical protein [Streptomyces sp. RerS4]|uniref:hypothetical protein n=1 Tax=Streptomyces sp. RerS4 TaxID=2942449 RepID=UPI00201C41C4|nr:hypothetical protein [Streptomyces sp. RerS4]UQX01990.1 hypothetical protein M4D82_16875 [Streptomyces sp. RerS4]
MSTWWAAFGALAAFLAAYVPFSVHRRKNDREYAAQIEPFTREIDDVIKARSAGSTSALSNLADRLDVFLVRPPRRLKALLELEKEHLTDYRFALTGLPVPHQSEIDAAISLSDAATPLREINERLRNAAVAFRRTR